MIAPTIVSMMPMLWIVLAVIVMLFWREVQTENSKQRAYREKEIQLLLSNQMVIENKLETCKEATEKISDVRRFLLREAEAGAPRR